MGKSSVSTWYAVVFLHRMIDWVSTPTVFSIAKSHTSTRYMRNAHRKSRTLASGSDMIRAPVHTTCIRNTGRCRGLRQLRLFIKTWQQDIELDSGPFMYVSSLVHMAIGLTL